MGIGETYTRLPPTEVFELFLNDPGTTTDDKLFLRQSLAAGKLLKNCLFGTYRAPATKPHRSSPETRQEAKKSEPF
jgi:hypothetical protein